MGGGVTAVGQGTIQVDTGPMGGGGDGGRPRYDPG